MQGKFPYQAPIGSRPETHRTHHIIDYERGPIPSTFHAKSASISYVWMDLIVPENTFLEVGPKGILY